MIRVFIILLSAWLLTSCSSSRVAGKAVVYGWEEGEYLVPNAEVLLVHKKDTLRTKTDELGRFDFGPVKYRSYFIDGRHPKLGVAELRAVNRARTA